METRIVPLALSASNAYLVLGDRPVLVDAGSPGEEDKLVAALRQHRVTPADLSLVVLTHGHTDHTGAVNAIARADVPIAIGAQDAEMLIKGANGPLPATGLAGTVLRPLVARMTFVGATPQILIREPLHLDAYGLGATIMPVPGHTPGSCVVLLDDDGGAIVGDLVRGGFAYGRIRPHHPLRHFFAEDVAGVRRAVDQVLQHEPRYFYVGHGGPTIETTAVRDRIDAIAPRH
ncbi:MBL fold metallo-hydrolase [soil metagenome]